MTDSELLIGEVARRAGLRPSAIRYYESIGLLPEPKRTAGRRSYSPATLRTLSVIAAGQRAGLSLGEVGELLAASDGDGAVSERLRDIAHRKLPEVKSLIERAQLVREWLEAAADCRCPTLDECPLFDDPGSRAPRALNRTIEFGLSASAEEEMIDLLRPARQPTSAWVLA